ncbi:MULTISPECIES: TetR/AcrR family transcriptional regulator [Actinomadura]|jgi:AcrR family transcriptional regulator|uniref:TetR/AcrR family transcriptional regulator n=1 Tax=Actinomadura geliboluensis TaxID=882440 RepID=A0A5S4HBL8_9ACTN|nr:helix-turn-helix domain-containing protein [Actinomadura geliboluensis]TMR42376.1 TetR/AcrR family transcriptional regulator [Actinomadura geliboluensis]
MRADALRNRDRILRAARDALLKRGPAASMEEIARRAGVGIATVYRHFPSRGDLVRAQVVAAFNELHDIARASTREEDEPFEALRRFMHGALDIELWAILPIMSGWLTIEEILAENGDDPVDPIQELMTRARTDGSLRGDVVLGDIVFAITRLSRPLPGDIVPEDRALAHRQLDVYIAGLRRSAAGAGAAPLQGPAINVRWFRQIRQRFTAVQAGHVRVSDARRGSRPGLAGTRWRGTAGRSGGGPAPAARD